MAEGTDRRASAAQPSEADMQSQEPTTPIGAQDSELAQAQREAEENQQKYLRARADMENYKKRIERTYADLSRNAKKDLLRKLLNVEDNLERALQYGGADPNSLLEGVRLTKYQLDQILEGEGVRPIDAQGKPFDPHLEEAVHTVDDPNVPDHTVVNVARGGYTYQDEVLRPAQVVVAVHGENEEPAG